MDLKGWNEAQRAVIGSLLIDPDYCAGEIFQTARPEHFGDAAVRHVFEAARALWTGGKPVDPVTVLAAAGNDYESLIRDAMKMTPTVANVGAHLEICRSSARLSAMQAEALAIINAESEDDATAAYERMGGQMQETGRVESMTLSEMIGHYLDRMHDRQPVDYLHWGIDRLDEVLYVSRGQFGVLAADSSVGKTALALQFALTMARTGKRVGFVSLETPWESLEDRLMAEHQLAGVPLPATKRKRLTEEEFRRVGEAGIRADGVPLRVIRGCTRLEEIRAAVLRYRLEVVFIDYVQLIEAEGQERWTVVTNISMGLHRMAQQLGVVVVGLSQITPAVKGQKQPTKDDLRESRQLKQDADFILLLYPDSGKQAGKDGDSDQGDAEPATTKDGRPAEVRVLEIAKNKDGRLGRMKLSFDAEHMTFTYRVPDVDTMRRQGQLIKEKNPTKAAKAADAGAVPVTKAGEIVPLDDQDGGEIPF